MDKSQQVARWGRLFEPMRGLALYLLNHVAARLPFHVLRLPAYRLLFRVDPAATLLLGVTCRGFRISIGRGSIVNSGTILDGRGAELRIGEYVDIAPNVRIWTLDHDPNSPRHAERPRPVTIENYVWIASGATILPGVTLGQGCVVAAGSVVTRDVEAYAVVGGIPARKIGERSRDLEPRSAYRPWFE